MRVVGKLEYKEFQTIVKLTKEVEEFLLKNGIDLNLSSRIPSAQYWYEQILFPLSLKDKNVKKFELIYCGIDKLEEYESLESIIKKLKLTKEDIIFDSSITVVELRDTFVRWIVVKA